MYEVQRGLVIMIPTGCAALSPFEKKCSATLSEVFEMKQGIKNSTRDAFQGSSGKICVTVL